MKKQLDQLDTQIIFELRKNSRLPYRTLAKKMSTTLATTYRRVQNLLNRKILRPIVFLNLERRFPVQVWMWMQANDERVLEYLTHHPHINTLCRLSNQKIVAEGFFSTIAQHEEVLSEIKNQGGKKINCKFVVNTFSQEAFFPRLIPREKSEFI